MDTELPVNKQTNMKEEVKDREIQLSLSSPKSDIKLDVSTEESESGGWEPPADDSIIHYLADSSTFG